MGNKEDKATITPLIQYLRDKKANKGKEATPAAKAPKHARHDSKESKIEPSPEKKVLAKTGKDATPSPDKKGRRESRVDRAAKEAVKLLNKRAVALNEKTSPGNSVTVSSVSPKDNPAPAPASEKRRERGNASAAARILQRDLGLGGPIGGRRGARRETSDISKSATDLSAPTSGQLAAPPSSKQERRIIRSMRTPGPEFSPTLAKVNLPPSNAPSGPSTSAAAAQDSIPSLQAPTGPSASRSPAAPNTPTRPNTSTLSPAGGVPTRVAASPTATQAFLKHANASQGVTEPLLQEAFASFGTVTKIEIDKKKGFAYVDFAEPEGLQKAMQASPIPVAQGNVVVLERKTGPVLQARNTRGGGMMGRGGVGYASVGRAARGVGRGRGAVMRGGGTVQSAASLSTAASITASAPTPSQATAPAPAPAAAAPAVAPQS